MSHIFGVEVGKLTRRERTRRERIAARHGAAFIYSRIPGTGLQSWFTARNYGEPHNGNTALSVSAEVWPATTGAEK